MIILDTTTKSLEVVLGAAVATNQLPIVAAWSDIEQSTFGCTGLGETDANTNSLTAVTAVAAPAVTTSRIVKYLSVQNADTAAVIATVRLNNNGTTRKILSVTLQPNDTLVYRDGHGFAVSDSTGSGKTGTGATFLGSGSFQKLDSLAASFTGAQTVFTLTAATVQVRPGTAENVLISLDGVIQEPETTYTVSANTIVFSSAPAANAVFFGVMFGGTVTGQMSPSALTVSGNTALGNTTVTGSLVVNNAITVTTTGAIDDLDFANAQVIFMNNASLSTIRGLKAGVNGQEVTIISIGAGRVDLAHANTSSAANNRLVNNITGGATPLAANTGTAAYRYDATTLRWRLVQHAQGAPLAYAAVIGGSTGTSGQTYSSQEGFFMVVDRTVFVQSRLTLTAKGTLTGLLQIQGFPFTVSNVGLNASAAPMAFFQGLSTNWSSLYVIFIVGTTAASVFGVAGTQGVATTSLALTDISNTTDLFFSGSYLAT